MYEEKETSSCLKKELDPLVKPEDDNKRKYRELQKIRVFSMKRMTGKRIKLKFLFKTKIIFFTSCASCASWCKILFLFYSPKV